jgi:hypothetical protein
MWLFGKQKRKTITILKPIPTVNGKLLKPTPIEQEKK